MRYYDIFFQEKETIIELSIRYISPDQFFKYTFQYIIIHIERFEIFVSQQ